MSTTTLADDPQAISRWDATLPSIQLENVHIEGKSLTYAWKNICTDYLLRSVLYVSEDTRQDGLPFSFSAARCRASELFNALIATYTDMTWTQDARTGVVWFHPRAVPLLKILPAKVRSTSEQLGVPMLSGILEPFLEDKPLRVRPGPIRGAGFINTHNYPVNVPQGMYTVRDLLNTCCVADPGKTFFIYPEKDITYITPVSLYPDRLDKLQLPRAGALHWWTTHFGRVQGREPQVDEVINKLASADPGVRSAARAYLLATVRPYTEELIRETADPERALWVCLAATDIHIRTKEATHTVAIERMKKEASEGFLLSCDPGLALLTALELARVAQDTRYLDIISQRAFAPGELSGIASDVFRIVRASRTVREALRRTGTEWLTNAQPELSTIGDPGLTHKARFSVQ